MLEYSDRREKHTCKNFGLKINKIRENSGSQGGEYDDDSLQEHSAV
jgi:hypothetical protein